MASAPPTAFKCVPCERIAEVGWNDTEQIHDGGPRGCHAIWTGKGRAHCSWCHQTFNSYGGADRHWTALGHMHPINLEIFVQRNGIWYLAGTEEVDWGNIHAG